MQSWKTHFDSRQLQEIELCKIYRRDFNHGTDGHNAKIIIAKLVELLEGGLVPTEQEQWEPVTMQGADCISTLAELFPGEYKIFRKR